MAHSLSVRFPMPGFEGDTIVHDFDGNEIDPAKLTYHPVPGRSGYATAMYIEIRGDEGVIGRAILKFNAKLGRVTLSKLTAEGVEEDIEDEKDEKDGAEKAKENGEGRTGSGIVTVQETTSSTPATGKKTN